jgi:replicative DNA helicase
MNADEKFRDDDTETALIGAVVADPGISGIVRQITTVEDFGCSKRAALWDAIGHIEAARAPVDVRTITAELTRCEQLNAVSSVVNLDALPFMRVAVSRAEHYAKMIAANGRARRVARELYRSQLKLESAHSAEAFADDVGGSMATAATKRTTARRRSLGEMALEYSDHVGNVLKNRGKITGLSTGIAALDKATGGMRAEQLIVIAGRPAMGKTSLGMKIATHVAEKERRHVAVFSLEMGDIELWERMVCDRASVDSMRVHSGDATQKDADALDAAAGELMNIPMTIIDQGGLRLEDIRGECIRLRESGLSLVVIDALGLMEHGNRPGANEATLIGNTTRRLKALAKELRIPIVLLCQLSRKCEEREDKRPVKSDLRDSGHIEQDADCVWLVYRDEVYAGTIEHDVPKTDRGRELQVNGKTVYLKRANKNRAEIIVAKQRGGRIGTIHVQFDAQFTRFANLEREVLPVAEIPRGYDTNGFDAWNEGSVDDAAE